MRQRVTILQEYIPAYRVPLFEQMRDLGHTRGIDIRIAAGQPHGFMSARGDAASEAADVRVRQREFQLLGKRMVVRKVSALYAQSDLVVVEQARRNLDVYAALLRRRRAVAMWGHGRDFTHSPGRLSTATQTAITNRASWFFGYTAESVDSVVSGGFPPGRTTTLWNSTDTKTLRSNLRRVSTEDVEKFRAGSEHVALFVGGLDRSKRLDLLVDACDRVAARLPAFTLVIGGAGEQSKAMAAAAASRPWLRLVGPLAGQSLAIALRSADIMTMPGRVGLVAVDALTAGVPVATTSWPYHGPERSYLDESNSVMSPENSDRYSAEIVDLLTDRPRLVKLAAGCDGPASRLSIEAMADRFVTGIEEALGSQLNGWRR